jgi:hypothetical protein
MRAAILLPMARIDSARGPELDPSFAHAAEEVRVLGEEPVARVHRVGAAFFAISRILSMRR